MAIIVAVFEKEEDDTWSHAWITHVSSDRGADKIYGIISKLNEHNYSRAYVAIGGPHGSKVWMDHIADAFNGVPLPPQPEAEQGVQKPKFLANQRGAAIQQPQVVQKPEPVKQPQPTYRQKNLALE